MTGFRIGDVEVHPLVDMDLFEVDLSYIFPIAEPDRLIGHSWLEPHHVDLARGIVNSACTASCCARTASSFWSTPASAR